MIAMLSNLITAWLVLTILSIGLSVSAGELLGTSVPALIWTDFTFLQLSGSLRP